jgi:hypothetical protein
MRKFYYEYDEVEGTWDVYEKDGGQNFDSEFYDVLAFCCDTEEDAIDAVDLLHELQEQ